MSNGVSSGVNAGVNGGAAAAELVIGLVSVSDRASGGVYQDQGIPALQDWLTRALATPFRLETRLIADGRPLIEATLVELVDQARCHLVLHTGGTGAARRDVTPEDTLAVGSKEMTGFGEQMGHSILRVVPCCSPSRQTGVIRETADHGGRMMARLGLGADSKSMVCSRVHMGFLAEEGTVRSASASSARSAASVTVRRRRRTRDRRQPGAAPYCA